MKDGAHVRLVLCVFGLVLLCNHSVHGACFRVGSKPRDPKGPFLEMRISEFPDKDVIPTGSNVTIVCTSNLSVPDTTKRHYGETYWMPFYFYDTKIGECGGYNDDSEESKTCKHYITNGTRSDSGDYNCQAHNLMGYCTEATRTLTFKDPSVPHFTVHPGHQLNVSNGNAASLACEASGVPRPVITWLKDGRPVSGASVKQVKGSSILTFESVSPIDQGMYWCEARNTEGSNTSSTVNMTVWWKPVFFVHPEIIYIHDSDNVTLSCEAAGFPRPVISWLKNNMSITNATSVQNGSVSSLSFHLVKGEEAAGKYKCVARNSMGETVSTEGALRIAHFASFRRVPSFYLHPESTTTSRDSKVKFTCAAQGFPLPTITWMKDGKAITDDDTDYFQSNYTSILSIRAVHERHVGRYWCVARSSVLNATSREATLSLKDTRNVSTEIVTEPVGDQPSEVVWIAVGAGVVALLCFAIGVIFLKQKRWHRASYKLNKEMIMMFGKNEGFVPEHIEQDLISQLRDRQPIAEGRQEEEQPNLEEDEAVDHETYLKLMGINRNWEISRERLAITEMKLGGGEFGVVKKGVYLRTDGSEMPVAVKLLKDNVDRTERQALIRELETLVQVGRHPNVVSLVGACTFGEPLCVVIEFVPGGSLDKVLRSSRVESGNSDPAYANIWSKLTERELLRIAADVANGMKHLESKHCVHRDLAARNVLIGPGLVAKVADFGMARDISTNGQYIKTTEGRIPWLWMSMEALRGTCTIKADVWSFGVVLWEITTLGELPYKGVRGVVELHNSLLEGLRLVKPPHCSQEIYDIMLWCWQESPEDRPSFEELRVTLQETLYTKDRTYINVSFFEEQTINETSEATI